MAKTVKIIKKGLGTFFSRLQALTNCKVSLKSNERFPRKSVTHTHERTDAIPKVSMTSWLRDQKETKVSQRRGGEITWSKTTTFRFSGISVISTGPQLSEYGTCLKPTRFFGDFQPLKRLLHTSSQMANFGQNGQNGENYQKSAWNIFLAVTSPN